jgi:ATP-binding cassette, subfamily F, member 3
MIELALNKIQKFYGAAKILENITFDVQISQKVGIVGRNGTGKTTILKIIYGIENQDNGVLSIRKGATLGYLDQIPVFPDNFSVLDVLESAFEFLYKLSSDMKDIEEAMSKLQGEDLKTSVDHYGELQHIFEIEGGYEIDELMSKVCDGLKISNVFKTQSFSTLSGGEKTTVILAKILLQKCDIMLLDEPSNHLDMESIEWLEDYLREYKGTALIVSHDRYFLDRVVTKIVEIEDMEAATYLGNYSAYIETKERNMLLQFEDFKDQQKKIHAMEKTIKELRDWGLRSGNNKFFRRAVSIEKRLDKMVIIEKPKFDKDNLRLNFSKTDRSGNEVIIIKDLIKAFDDKTLLYNANLLVRYGERAALIGKNGCGKSTLIKVLLQEYEANSGSALLGANTRIGYLPQNITFKNEENTVLAAFREDIEILEGKAREYLSKFMFYGESVFKRVKNLSGGEKSRLKLSMLMYEEINLLILDEPTNHLDIDSMESLEETLTAFKGTIFFISHDRYFINSLCTRIIEIREKAFISYDGNYDHYKEQRNKERDRELAESLLQRNNIKAEKIKSEKPFVKSSDSNLRKVELHINELENKIQALDGLINDFSTDHEKLSPLLNNKSILQEELDALLEEWLLLQ